MAVNNLRAWTLDHRPLNLLGTTLPQCRFGDLVEDRPDHGAVLTSICLITIDRLDEGQCFGSQFSDYVPRVRETACTFHVTDCIQLDFFIFRLLLENAEELMVSGVGADTMDDGKGELSLREVFTKTFVLGVRSVGQVEIVVADLENQSHDVDKAHAVLAGATFGLH